MRVFAFLFDYSFFGLSAVEVLVLVHGARVVEVAEPSVVFYPSLRLARLVAEGASSARPVVVVEVVRNQELFDHMRREV